MLNVHIYPSTFTHESRILKEAATLSRKLGFEKIRLVGVAGPGLPPEEVVDETTTIHRLAPEKGEGLAKAVRHLIWCLNVVWYCLKRRPGCVNCHSLPVLPIGVAIKLLTGAQLVYDAHELETETAGSKGLRRTLGKIVERACIGAVDLLIVVSPAIETWYREHYRLARSVTVLNAPMYQARTERGTALRDALGIGTAEKIILYQGVLVPHRGIEELVNAAPLLRTNGYVVVLMGPGRLTEMLNEKSRSEGQFYVHPAVNSNVLLSYTASADIGLSLIQDACLSYHYCLPNKIFEYMMAGLPVIASGLPEMRRVIEGERVGVCLDAYDPQAILEAIVRVDTMKGPDLDARLDAVARTYSWEVQEERLVAAYREAIV